MSDTHRYQCDCHTAETYPEETCYLVVHLFFEHNTRKHTHLLDTSASHALDFKPNNLDQQLLVFVWNVSWRPASLTAAFDITPLAVYMHSGIWQLLDEGMTSICSSMHSSDVAVASASSFANSCLHL